MTATGHILTRVSRERRHGSPNAACPSAVDPLSMAASVDRSPSNYAPIFHSGAVRPNVLGAGHTALTAHFVGVLA
ncbi:hypothetical protein [Sphingomonas sp. So64.6b]|uniref:hypothetical protein n=1 Tax=Sphingomonas sp. So64.6b TaxID=2997354 RepID=UPI001AEEF38C|nr:hypothetical protein [Sphingomonas sp. So64.6b]